MILPISEKNVHFILILLVYKFFYIIDIFKTQLYGFNTFQMIQEREKMNF